MNLTKSVRQLAVDMNMAAPDEFDINNTHFNSVFDLLDKDNNGTLSREEAYTLVSLFESEKTRSASLKKNLLAVAGISTAIILVLCGATVGAVFIAVNATKDTKVSSSGALMTKDGSRQLSTISQGTRFQLFNTSKNTSLCFSAETFEEIQNNVLQGSKVVLDVEEEGLDERSIISLDAATRITKSGTSCFSSLDGKERCYAHALPGECDFVNSFGIEGLRPQPSGESLELGADLQTLHPFMALKLSFKP